MSANNKQSWCIIGGGILGLTLAYRLAQAGHDITIIEASDKFGGLADSWSIGDVTWDRHYHVTLLSDFYLREILEDLELENQLIWGTTNTDFYTGENFFQMNNVIDFLRFPPLSFLDKCRQAATIKYCSTIRDGTYLEKIPLKDWLIKLSGRNTYDKIWLPLLRAKLGDNHQYASAAFIWAIIRRLYAARRSGLKTEMFGYVKGGYNIIFKRFEALLERYNVKFVLSAPVERIYREGEQFFVQTKDSSYSYDRAVVSAASSIATRICQGLSDKEVNQHNSILYQGIVCASVLLKKPLRGAYVTYITDESVPFTAVIEMSALVDPETYNSNNLVYLPKYIPSDSSFFDISDTEIEMRFVDALLKMYPHLNRSDIIDFKVSKVRNVLAVSTLNYSDNLPSIHTSVPGLSIVNSAQIVNGTLNVNETIKLANETSQELLNNSNLSSGKVS